MFADIASLVQFVSSNQSRIFLDIFDDTKILETRECTMKIVCAIVIVKAPELTDLMAGKVHVSDWTRALRIVDSLCASSVGIDMPRLLRDARYAGQVAENLTQDMIESLYGHFFILSLNSFGCRIVQKVLDLVSPTERVEIMRRELSDRLLDVCVDVNGNHVVQKYIELAQSRDCEFIVSKLESEPGSVIRLASHCYGCRVIQRLMTRCNAKDVEYIFDTLCATSDSIVKLSVDIFGNYVMQQVVEFGRDIDRERIGLCLASCPDIVVLGCSKYASNVVEKCIRYQNKRRGCVMVTKLLLNSILTAADPETGEPGLLTLMKDRYGNYVVRAMIELTSVEFARETEVVRNIIAENGQMLKKFTFSWHLVERLEKLNASTDIGADD